MNGLNSLIARAGEWRGKNLLQDPETNQPEESVSTLTLTPVLENRFVRAEYTWQYRGTAQEGCFLIGYEADTQTISLHWIDTWHMGDKVMACRGIVDARGRIAARGSYAAGDGPDWGWTIQIDPGEDQTLRVAMANVAPDGQEYPAVEGLYSREPA